MITLMQSRISYDLVSADEAILIADCDHDSINMERLVAEAAGVPLTLATCRTEEDVIAAARDATAIILQYAPITARVMDALPKLRVVGRYGVGVDTIDVRAASERGIAVCNVPDYGTEDVSDHAVALIADASRGVTAFDRAIRAGQYSIESQRPLHRFNARRVGVIGAGLIGRATARKARGLGFDVVAADPTFAVGDIVEGTPIVSLDDLLREADVVSLHVPLIAATRHLINAAALAKMKPSAILVNTCRGGVVDTDALVDALERRSIRAAALDVFEEEPIGASHPLAQSPHTVLTPHVAWYSEESFLELKERVTKNVIAALRGELIDVVNASELARSSVGVTA